MAEQLPTFHDALYEAKVAPIALGIREELEHTLRGVALTHSHKTSDALRRAYLAGLEAGFVQGVEAASKRES